MTVEEKQLGSISNLIERTKHGSDSAACQLLSRCRHRMQDIARRGLNGSPRAVADEDDVVIVAYTSFLARMRSGGYSALRNRGELWRLLAAITKNHAIRQTRLLSRLKRGKKFRRVVGSGPDDYLAQIASGDQSPEEQAMLSELLTRLLELLPDDECRDIAMLRLAGHSNAEIATEVHRAIATVERRTRLVRVRWQAFLEGDGAIG